MQKDLDQSLVTHSEFLPIGQSLTESLIGMSEKVYFANASKINREQYEKNKKQLSTVGEGHEEESQNEFLDVGKWKKAKDSATSSDMAIVQKQLEKISSQTRWHQNRKVSEEEEEVIADQSIVPEEQPQKAKEEDIEDQTQNEDQSEYKSGALLRKNKQQTQPQDQSEQSQQQDGQQEEEMPIKKWSKVKSTGYEEKQLNSQLNQDDKTDTQSQMKRTQYMPSKWNKKRQSLNSGPSKQTLNPWQRIQAILIRIAALAK